MSFEKKPFKKSLPFKRTFPATYSTDLLTYDNEIVNELYSLISSGDYYDIKKFMMENNINNLNIKDENNNSILHEIISNSNLTKFDKTNLSRLLIKDGAPISIQNNKKETPLHLASKYHLVDIVGDILKHDIDYNLTDNNNMNALHYATLPENSVCIKPYTFSKDLIPEYANIKNESKDEDDQLNSEKLNSYLNKDIPNIIEKIKENDDELKFLQTLFSKKNVILNNDIEDILSQYNKENFPDNKETIKSKYISNINDYLNSKFTKSNNLFNLNDTELNDLDYDNGNLEKIIKYKNLSDFFNERETILRDEFNNANNQLKRLNNELQVEINKINDSYTEITDFFKESINLSMNNGYDNELNNNNNNQQEKLNSYFFNMLDNNNQIKQQLDNFNKTQFNEINLTFDNIQNDLININNNFINKLFILIFNISILHICFYSYHIVFDNLEKYKKYNINYDNLNIDQNLNKYISKELPVDGLNNKNDLDDLFVNRDPNFNQIKELKPSILKNIDNIYNIFLKLNRQKNLFFEIINKNYSFNYIKNNFFNNEKFEKNDKFDNCLLSKINTNKDINKDTISNFITNYCGYDKSYYDKDADLKNDTSLKENIADLIYLKISDKNNLIIYNNNANNDQDKKDGLYISTLTFDFNNIALNPININIANAGDKLGKIQIVKDNNDEIPDIVGVDIDTLVYGIKYIIIKKLLIDISNNIEDINDDKYFIGKNIRIMSHKIFVEKTVTLVMKETILKIIDDLFKKFINDKISLLSKNLINNKEEESENLFIDFNDKKMLLSKEEIIDKLNDFIYQKLDNEPSNMPEFASIYREYTKNNQHVIINHTSKDSICFELDDKIIDVLIEGKVDPNKRDSMGNIPLIYAIDLKNIEIIKKFLETKIINLKSKNINNYDCLSYSLSKIKNQKFDFIEFINKKNNEIKNNIVKDTNFNKNIIKSQKILDMVYYLVNHQFYLYSSELLEENLEELNIDINNFPFSEKNFSTDDETIERLLIKFEKKLEDKNNNLSRLQNQQKNLEGFSDEIKTKIKNEIESLEEYVEKIEKTIENIKEKKKSNNIKISDIKLNDLEVFKNYDKIVEKIKENNYYKIWNNYDYYGDKIMLLNKLLENNEIDNENKSIPELLNIYKSKINNYFDLDQIYSNENKTLKNVFDIINHVIKNTLTHSFYQMLNKYIIIHFEYIKKLNTKENINIDDVINNDLKEFLKLKTKDIIRYELNIKKNYDEELKSTLDILEESLDFIINNNKININKNDKLIKNLIDYILPYYEKNYKIYITESKNLVDKFLRYVLDIQSNYDIYSLIKEEY